MRGALLKVGVLMQCMMVIGRRFFTCSRLVSCASLSFSSSLSWWFLPKNMTGDPKRTWVKASIHFVTNGACNAVRPWGWSRRKLWRYGLCGSLQFFGIMENYPWLPWSSKDHSGNSADEIFVHPTGKHQGWEEKVIPWNQLLLKPYLPSPCSTSPKNITRSDLKHIKKHNPKIRRSHSACEISVGSWKIDASPLE